MKHYLTKSLEQQVEELLAVNRMTPPQIAKRLNVPISCVAYVQRKRMLYVKPAAELKAKLELAELDEHISRLDPQIVSWIMNNRMLKDSRSFNRIFPGADQVIRDLDALGFRNLSIARALGMDAGVVRALKLGKHQTQRPKTPPPRRQVELFEPTSQPQLGLFRRAWRYLFA